MKYSITTEWRYLDKSDWGFGPWQDEPDKILWTDEVTGYPCMIVRNPTFGNLCGYAAVPEGHPTYGRDCGDVAAHVTANINFSAACAAENEGDVPVERMTMVCHPAEPGDPPVWWFGFDCGHIWDFQPAAESMLLQLGIQMDAIPSQFRNATDSKSILRQPTYKDVTIVREWCARLAEELEQIKAV